MNATLTTTSPNTAQKKPESDGIITSSKPKYQAKRLNREEIFMRWYQTIKGANHFLVPPNYPGHEHKWIHLDAGLSICDVCGADHICFQGTCPTVQMEHSESVCSISGCVIVLSELQAEWAALERVQPPTHKKMADATNTKNKGMMMMVPIKKRGAPYSMCHTGPASTNSSGGSSTTMLKTANSRQHHVPASFSRHADIHDLVEIVVAEILNSQKTIRCMTEEASRDQTRKVTFLARMMRETISSTTTATTGNTGSLPQRPNMILLEARLSWQCRKCRALLPQVVSPLSLS